MDWLRLRHTLGMCMLKSGAKRAKYLRKHKILRSTGENCMVMFRKIPLYPRLISLGNNVWIASNVTFVTHDVIHKMLKRRPEPVELPENVGCIEIKDNSFIGSDTTILSNVSIGPNAVVGAGSLVSKSIGSGVYAGVPAKYICSIEEFIEKRENMSEVRIKGGRFGLSEETENACWERFRKMN